MTAEDRDSNEPDSVILAAASLIRTEIQKSTSPLENLDISAERILETTPNILMEFLRAIGNRSETMVLSIAQDIIYLATRRIQSKQMLLANLVKHKTGSVEVIDHLNRLGHACSATELTRITTGLASNEIAGASESGIIIPPNIQPATFGFIQAAADNDDFQEDTRDGKNTTHGTTMVLFQRLGDVGDGRFGSKPIVKSRARYLEPSQYMNLIKLKDMHLSKQKPSPLSIRGTAGLRTLQERSFSQISETMNTAVSIDHDFIFARLAPTKLFELDVAPLNQNVPSWSSLNCRRRAADTHIKSVVGYCPMLNYRSTDPSTIYTVMDYIQTVTNKLGQPYTVLTFDLALYKIAKEVQWARPIEFEHTYIKMGGFHIMVNYLSALGSMHESSGLRQLLIEAGLYSNVTVNQIFDGKHYNRAVRTQKLLYEVLYRKKLQSVVEWMKRTEQADPLLLVSETDASETDALEALKSAVHSFEEATSQESEMSLFWNSSLHSIQVLLCFIRSERDGDWELHVDSLIAMLPIMFAYDRTNYSRWLPIYICDMLNLKSKEPELYEEFKRESFSVNRTGKPIAGLSPDQVLEQTLNRDSKTSGGIIGFSNDEKARTKWFTTTHLRAHLLTVQRELCHIDKYSAGKHKEDNADTTRRDEEDLRNIMSKLDLYKAKLFDTEPNRLVNIATGVSPDITGGKAIVTALNQGADRAREFIAERLDTDKKSFYAPLPKQKVPNFSCTLETEAKKAKSFVKPVPFAKLAILAKSRPIDMTAVLRHELGSIPAALFKDNGEMRKTQKCQLTHAIEELYLKYDEKDYSNKSKAIVVDMMSIIQTSKPTGTFAEYAKYIQERVLKMAIGYTRLDMVFDVYHQSSIKSAECARRGAQKMCDIKLNHDSIQVPKDWQGFLSNLENKNELVSFLVKSWSSQQHLFPAGLTVYISAQDCVQLTSDKISQYGRLLSNHDEADTRLILHAEDALQNLDLAVIRSVDTDVLVIALHHFKEIMERCVVTCDKDLIMHIGSEAQSRYIPCSQVVDNMPTKVLQNLLAMHALTGCDTTSALFNVGKKKAIKLLERGKFDMTTLGCSQPEQPDFEEAERFVAQLYGNFYRHHLREI